MADLFAVSTDQAVSSDEEIDVVVNGCGAVPYVLDLDVEIEQHVEVEQLSEIDLGLDDACEGLALAVDVDQEAYLEQTGSVEIDIEEDNGLVSVDLEVDIVQMIRIEDAIRIDAEDGDEDGGNEVRLDVEQDVTTVQTLALDIEIEDEVLALVNVDADQCAAMFQGVDVLVDLSSGAFVVDVDTVQDADLDDSLVISFDIREIGQVQVARAAVADSGVETLQAGGHGERVVGGFGGMAPGAAPVLAPVAALGAGFAGGATFHWTGGDVPDGDDGRAGDGAAAPAASAAGGESVRWTHGGGIVGLGDAPSAAVSAARGVPDAEPTVAGHGAVAVAATVDSPADSLAAVSGLLLAGRTSNQAGDASGDAPETPAA